MRGLRWWRESRPMQCREVGRVLQSFLDGEIDDLRARRVLRHLEDCRRCGLEAVTYAAIKEALGRRGGELPPEPLDRLRRFGERLAAGTVDADLDGGEEPAGA